MKSNYEPSSNMKLCKCGKKRINTRMVSICSNCRKDKKRKLVSQSLSWANIPTAKEMGLNTMGKLWRKKK